MLFDPKISIVIPVYNGANYLGEALDSALGQTYRNIEVIVVNDGSNDGNETEKIAKSYGSSIRYFYKKNGGVASALNFGIEQMTGEYFSWLSHDDVYYPHKIQAQISYLQGLENKSVVLYSDYDMIDRNSVVIDRYTYPSYPPEQFLYEVLSHSFLHGCSSLVPRRCFDAVGVFDTSLKTTQDYHLWVRMAKRFDFIHMCEVLIKSRQHPEQGSLKLDHLTDIDDFYVWCLSEAPSANIRKIYGINPSRFYSNIALGYRRRKLGKAYQKAVALANKHARMEGGFSFVLYKVQTSAGFCLLSSGIGFVKKLVTGSFRARNSAKWLQNRFTRIYDKNIWDNDESRSGVGSSLEQTAVIRKEVQRLVRELEVKTLIDAPCGDFNWMKEVDLGVENYIGVDIVEKLIRVNNARYGNSIRHFLCHDLTMDELPRADLILCRDCLVHLTFEEALKGLGNFKRSGARYLLTTTFPACRMNEERSEVGNDVFWRPLNLQLSPFNFPQPLRLINEECTECGGQFADKCLGLWRMADLKF